MNEKTLTDAALLAVESGAALDLTFARAAVIAMKEANGWLDPNCRGCDEHYAFYRNKWTPENTGPPWAPSHRASAGCKSGKRNHCTCDTCF